MLDRRTFLAGAAAPLRCSLAARASRSRRPRPTGASSSSSSAAPPTGSAHRRADRRSGLRRPARRLRRRISRGGARLGDFFTLHPALAETARLYAGARGAVRPRGRLALSRPLAFRRPERARDRRQRAPTRLRDGWMNRLLGLLPASEAAAIAVSATVPMALRGTPRGRLLRALGAARARRTICSPGSAASTSSDAQLHAAWDAGDADPDDGRRRQPATAARTAPPPARSRRGCWPAPTARGSR